MKKNDYIINSLRKKGFRITNARRQIISALQNKHCAQSAQDLHAHLHQNRITVNLSTIYRELQFLNKEHVIQEVLLNDGIQRFEIRDQDHHHHLICNQCHSIQAIEMEQDLDDVEKKIHTQKGFRVLHHNLEFYGACKECI